MRHCEEEMKGECNKRDELLAQIRTCLAGHDAEILCYGREQGLNTGASGDLDMVTRPASRMISIYGMDDDVGLL